MGLVIIYMLLSFFMDAFMSLLFNFSLNTVSIFKTIYTVIALVLIFDYFENEKKYLFIILMINKIF